MTQVQEDTKGSKLVNTVYSIIKANSGKATTKSLEHSIGNKEAVRYAITRLTLQGKIKRIKGFGSDKIEYFYQVL